MPNTITHSFGDVVLVPFPFTDQTAAKKRPVVVVRSDGYNNARPDLIVMAVTGHLSGYPRIGEAIVSDWQAAGLLKASTLKPILTTVEKSLVIRTLGELSHKDHTALRDVLRIILG